MLWEFTIYTSPSCTQKPWNTDARQTESMTCVHGSMVYELALSLAHVVFYSMRTADGSEVRPNCSRSSSGRNHMHAWYIRYHEKMPRSSWRKFLVIDTPDIKKMKRLCAQHFMTLYTSKGQRVGGAVPKDINGSVFFFPRGNRVCRNRN